MVLLEMSTEANHLIESARNGDATALEELMLARRTEVVRYAMRLCVSPEDAEDAAQEALLALSRYIGRLREVAALIRARPGHEGPMVRWRKRLAAAWHVLAVLYLGGLWLVWAVDVPNGFRLLLRFSFAQVFA